MRSENQKRYRSTHYLTSANQVSQLDDDSGVEIAFSGRSNSGKSSAINTICDHRALARVSRTPGRTQMINFFEVSPGKRIVDLPGYGYAKVPEKIKLHWQHFLQTYFATRQSLQGLIIIVDIRRELDANDWLMLEWSHVNNIVLHILLTKADKLKRGAKLEALRKAQNALHARGMRASAQIFSSETREGLEESLEVLNRVLGFESAKPTPT